MFDIKLVNMESIEAVCREIGKFYTDWDYLIQCCNKYEKTKTSKNSKNSNKNSNGSDPIVYSKYFEGHYMRQFDFRVLFLFERFNCIQHWFERVQYSSNTMAWLHAPFCFCFCFCFFWLQLL